MESLRLASLRAFWVGIAIGVAFRTFAYGILIVGEVLLALPRLPSSASVLFAITHWMVAFFAPFWVPFVGGFLSSYVWRALEPKQQSRAVWRTNLCFLVLPIALLLAFGLGPALPALLFLVYADISLCAAGAEHGGNFWNGRLGRQFSGRFLDAGGKP